MNNNPLTLFCLVDGEATTNAVPVEVEPTKTIGDFKKLIKTEKTNDFSDIDADKLTLWCVSIPDDNLRSSIKADALGDKTQLNNPRTRLSKLFPESPDDNTYIFVQRPPPVQVPTPRLANGRDAHVLLVMLGLELDKQAKASDGKTTLRSIVEDDIGKLGHSVIAMVAPSGSGKTATVIDLATKHFVVYCVCYSTEATDSPEFGDPNFAQLASDVEAMYATAARTPGIARDLLEIESETHRLVRERVELEFLARLLFLQLLLIRNLDLEPQQFFREQTTAAGTSTIRELVKVLKEYDSLAIQYMLDNVQTKLHAHLEPRCCGLAIALDEAQVAATKILAGKFTSPSAMAAYWNARNPPSVLFDKDEIHRHHRRGFLTPLSATLSRMQATLVILGTAISLQDVDREYTSIGEDNNFIRITDFPLFDEDDGRPQFSLGIVNILFATGSIQDSKQNILESTVAKQIESVKHDLRDRVRNILASDQTGEASRLLCRMVLAYHFQDAKMSFSSSQQADFVDRALCRLRALHDGVHLFMEEPLVVEVVEEELKASNKDPSYVEYLDQLHRIVANLGASSAAKGAPLALLVRRSLQRFNGVRLVDLPFLQDVVLPDWCVNLQLQIDDINTASGFGYKGSDAAADLAFLTDCPPSKMLVASSVTRPDGIWFFPDKRYAGSLAIKLYDDYVPQQKHKENETSSDVRACFLKADGVKGNQAFSNIQLAYEGTGTPSSLKGILRIHVEFPRVKGGTPVTYIKKDPTSGVEDVMVYIDQSNMDSFFDKDIEAHRDDMVKLKGLIKYISAT
ncbi:hypothetical protein F5H01DRAFT_324052 [Linnemannia elongata]|nr:hypothetical protein F5H01DRAFT_324052 [Linnemannia elongata]